MQLSTNLWILVVSYVPMSLLPLFRSAKRFNVLSCAQLKTEDMYYWICMSLSGFDLSTLSALLCSYEKMRELRDDAQVSRRDLLLYVRTLPFSMKEQYLKDIKMVSWSECLKVLCQKLKFLNQRKSPFQMFSSSSSAPSVENDFALPCLRPVPSFSLLSPETWFVKPRPCFIMCGPDGSGKTTFINTLQNRENRWVIQGWLLKRGQSVFGTVESWDYDVWAYEETIYEKWRLDFRHSDALIWMVDGTSKENDEFWGMCRYRMREILFDRSFPSSTLLVLVNKLDCEDSGASRVETVARISDLLKLSSLPSSIRWHILPISCIASDPSQQALRWLHDAVTMPKRKLFKWRK